PGPAAVARLVRLGATATKIEPPDGDPLRGMSAPWHEELHRGIDVRRADLRDQATLDALHADLARADLLVTSQRDRTIRRLGLADLGVRWPRLCHVAIVGHAPPDDDRPGHDITYLAAHGLLDPPRLPRTLAADLLGAARAVEAALALLLSRERAGTGGRTVVALADAARDLAAPLARGLTAPGGILGGGFAPYGLYRAADGWIALGALEPHFAEGVRAALGIANVDGESLAGAFAQRTVA